MPDAGDVAGHELNHPDNTGAHRLVATGMVVIFVTIFIAQDWWTHVRDFISTRTHGPATQAKPGG